MKTWILCLFAPALLAAAEPAAKPANGKVNVEQAITWIKADVQLVDVRTEEEWNDGHLDKAVRITSTEKNFEQRAKAQLDPAKPVLVYCRVGGRSAEAAKRLKKAGFTQILDLKGGILAWKSANQPVVK